MTPCPASRGSERMITWLIHRSERRDRLEPDLSLDHRLGRPCAPSRDSVFQNSEKITIARICDAGHRTLSLKTANIAQFSRTDCGFNVGANETLEWSLANEENQLQNSWYCHGVRCCSQHFLVGACARRICPLQIEMRRLPCC